MPPTAEEIARPAIRPANSVLNYAKIEGDTSFIFRPWQEALREYLKNRMGVID